LFRSRLIGTTPLEQKISLHNRIGRKEFDAVNKKKFVSEINGFSVLFKFW